jgi:AcrR family transcriptional regulator
VSGSRIGTKTRIVAEAMRLFGEQGYQSTTIAVIEAAAGLSPGAGGLYRHFTSKRAVLEEGIRRQIEAGDELVALMDRPEGAGDLPLPDRLAAIARAGLRRLEEERDINRLLLRDLNEFPDLLQRVEHQDLRRVFGAVTQWLRALGAEATQADPAVDRTDWSAIAAAVVGAITHYWIIVDVLGHHPDGIAEDRYVAAIVDLLVALFESQARHRDGT